MTGIFVVQLKNATKLIHLRNVASVTLRESTLVVHYNFPCVTGECYYEKVESKPAFDEFVWPTKEKAQEAFAACKAAFEHREKA